jgi:hypothetical protein
MYKPGTDEGVVKRTICHKTTKFFNTATVKYIWGDSKALKVNG